MKRPMRPPRFMKVAFQSRSMQGSSSEASNAIPTFQDQIRIVSSTDVIRVFKKTKSDTFSSTRAASSLFKTELYPCFCNHFNSTLEKAIINFIGSTVHQQTNQISDKFYTVYLDTHNNRPWRLQAVRQNTYED